MKRGSALLIVLGMTAFMVISAVAFSAYMRYSRLPSSYLRRTSSSRQLVKAALAEAIDIIDIAIGNDPFPGLGDNGRSYGYPRADTENESSVKRRRNYWRDHCFVGTNQLVEASKTVSTLTMEGLAYLPPGLINEARYYSRHGTGGMWHNLGFDSGRFAFTAIDVSDHIDINRVFADAGRNSSDRGRITLAHVFENAQHTSYGSISPNAWDTFMDKFLKVDDIKDGEPNAYRDNSRLPLISLADLNLAVNRQGWSQLMSPFCQFLNTKGSEDFVVSIGETDQKSEMLRNMKFITDSYLPNTNNATAAQYDLCTAQPFRRMLTGSGSQMSVEDIISQTDSSPMLLNAFTKHLSDIDKVNLYDYLDENDIPASLSLPSVERVPMICGVQPRALVNLKVKKDWGAQGDPAGTPPTAADPETKDFEHVYKVDSASAQAMLSALFAYPFRRDDAKSPRFGGFQAEYAVRIGFCDVTTGNNLGPAMRTVGNSPFVVKGTADFTKDNVIEDGVLKFYKRGRNVGSKQVNNESDAMDLDSPVETSDVGSQLNGRNLFTVLHTYKKGQIPGSNPPQYVWQDQGPSTTADPIVDDKFYPIAANGNSLRDQLVSKLKTSGEIEVRPFMTVTVRVIQGGNTVDLVPASSADDNRYNPSVNNAGMADFAEFNTISGNPNSQQPVLTFAGDVGTTFKFSEAGSVAQFTGDLKPQSGTSIICPDPRWNFAPENFYEISEALQAGNWFHDRCGVGEQGRDNDMFMAVSNQGYMQSPSEIAFLPRTILGTLYGNRILETISGDICNRNFNRTTFEQYPGASVAFDALLHGRFMWRTYTPYDKNGRDADELYSFGIRNEGKGFRINPFTSSRQVMLAALANTPVSWWAASTNDSANTGLAGLGAEEFNRRYAFNEMNSTAKVAWKDLKKVADKFVNVFRNPDGDWMASYEDAWATYTTKGEYLDYLCGVQLEDTDDLYEVDRKFLYGFWRDSFAAKQQLFLVFVRAEPMMMGGGAIGQAPPQLGARAVALVWRDPNPTQEDVGGSEPRPHRTRILFYRQFD